MIRKLKVLIFIAFGTALLNAQSPDLLTLRDCIQLAEQKSFRLQSDEHEIIATEKMALVAKSRAIPSIGGELATENRFLQPYYFNQTWADIHADWSLGDLIMKSGRSALQDVETRRLEKEQNRLAVIGRSTSLYMSILQVEKQMEILETRLKFLQQHRELSESMWKAGLRTQLDVLQTESEILKIKEDTERLDIVRINLNVELAGILELDYSNGLRLSPVRLDSITALPVPVVSIQNLANNPIIATLDSRAKAQQFRTNEIDAGRIPHVQLGTGYVGDGDPTGDGNYLRINAGVSIPIYSGNAFNYQKEESDAIIESLDAQKLDAERELMIHLFKIREKLDNQKKLIELQNQRHDIDARAVDIAEINYQAGISSNLDYLSSQQQLTSTELTLEETRLEYTMSLIEYYITTNQTDQIIALGNN